MEPMYCGGCEDDVMPIDGDCPLCGSTIGASTVEVTVNVSDDTSSCNDDWWFSTESYKLR